MKQSEAEYIAREVEVMNLYIKAHPEKSRDAAAMEWALLNAEKYSKDNRK